MKKWFLIGGFLIITGFILFTTLVPRVYQREITIKAPLLRLYKQISLINNFSKWYSPFAETDAANIIISGKDKISNDQTTLQIVTLNEKSCLLRISENNQLRDILYSITADTINRNQVTLLYKTTIWKKLLGNDPIIQHAEKNLISLKEYTENTKRIYGYPISLTEVIDTAFLFTSKIVANKEKKESIKELYRLLKAYAADKDAGYTGVSIFYITAVGKDSVQLYQSIGISKNTMQIPLYGPMSIKRMPYKKNLIVASYEGKFAEIPKVFNALEQFSIDRNMTSMAIPFIKLSEGENDFDDEKIITANAYYPVR